MITCIGRSFNLYTNKIISEYYYLSGLNLSIKDYLSHLPVFYPRRQAYSKKSDTVALPGGFSYL